MKWLLSLLVCCLVVMPGFSEAAITRNLAPTEAFELVSQRRDVFLLDVRTFGEYQQARLEGAQLVPIDQLVSRLAEVPRNRPVLVYCAVGSRSAQVVNYLARNGFPEVYNLAGGIYAWAGRGLPILQGSP